MNDPNATHASPATILVIDDVPDNLRQLSEMLGRCGYRVMPAQNGSMALRAAAATPPDLILLDIRMPGMDGYETCARFKDAAALRDIPVIFISALSDTDDKIRAFDAGGVDYITKPFHFEEVQARVRTHLSLLRATRSLARQNELLEEKVLERTRELAQTQEVTIQSLATLAETRDNETGGHILRTQRYVKLLAEQLSRKPGLADILNGNFIDLLFKSAPLHDIGKVGVPDAILLKPGPLTDEEFAVMRQHTVYGRDALTKAINRLDIDSNNSFLNLAILIAYSHHEHWDGTGYPEGLAGEAIPLAGRLMALADVYDALISRRVYKPPFPHGQALALIRLEVGRHFDPAICEAFFDSEEEFRSIAIQFADSPEERKILQES
jgi:putative two-component system response regulator